MLSVTTATELLMARRLTSRGGHGCRALPLVCSGPYDPAMRRRLALATTTLSLVAPMAVAPLVVAEPSSAGSTTSTNPYFSLAEDVSGQSLDAFFVAWIDASVKPTR